MRALHVIAVLFFCVSPIIAACGDLFWTFAIVVGAITFTGLILSLTDWIVEFVIEEAGL